MALDSADQLQKLVGLARRHARRTRRVLAENTADLFLSDEGRLSDRESAIMSDVLRKLVHQIERAVCAELARRLGETETVPGEVIVALTDEAIDIAHPILLRGSVLRDVELVELVKHRTVEHLLISQRRSRQAPDVTEVLVRTTSEDAVESLLKTGDAGMARRAMDYLVDQARRVDRFQHPLLRPADLPTALIRRLTWWISAAMCEHLVATAKLPETMAEDFLKETTRLALEDMVKSATAESPAEALAARLDQSGELTGTFLVSLLRQGHMALFLAALAQRGAVGRQTARRIVFDASGEALAIACKALGLERKEFAAVVLLTRRSGETASPTEVLSRIAELFDSLSIRTAFLALRYWQEDRDYLQAVEEIRQEAG